MQPDVHCVEPERLRPIFDSAFGEQLWSSEDLGGILRHQMRTPLRADLDDLDREVVERCRGEAQARGVRLFTFGDLFIDPHPPLELLVLVQRFAKASRQNDVSRLPPEIATVLYYAVILTARLRRDQSISELSAADVRQGTQWFRGQSWLDPVMAAIFEQAASFESENKDVP